MPKHGRESIRGGPNRSTKKPAIAVLLAGGCYAALSSASSFALVAALLCATVMAGTLAGYPAYLSLVEPFPVRPHRKSTD